MKKRRTSNVISGCPSCFFCYLKRGNEMRELCSEQLKQISGGVVLGLSDINTYKLVLEQYEYFFLANYQTGDIYFFQGNGSVLFMNPLSDVSYPMSFPFTIDNELSCEFSVPSKLF